MVANLASAYEQSRYIDPKQREEQILSHLPQVRLIAQRLLDRLPSSFQLEDLVSAGVVGLIAAVDNFDPSLNIKLRTYAEFKIRGAILNSIRGADGIPAHRRTQAKQISLTIRKLEQKLQRAPSEEEVAGELKMSLEQYREQLSEVRSVTIGSLDEVTSSEDDRPVSATICDEKEELPLHRLQKAELQELLKKGIEAMPPPERTVLNLYYVQERNLREISVVMNIHLSRVAQLKTQGILRLRGLLATQWPSDRGLF